MTVRYVPGEQTSHAGGSVKFVALAYAVALLGISQYVQLALLVAPKMGVKEPSGHAVQLLLLVAPTAPLNVPGGQNEQLASADALVGELA